MGTQWRIGMAGPTGLDYSALPIVAEANSIKLTAQRLDDIRIMESEALRLMNEKRNEGKQNG